MPARTLMNTRDSSGEEYARLVTEATNMTGA